jgi:hypothetical protein
MRLMNSNKFIVIVQFQKKHVNYAIKRFYVTRYVRKRKGVRLAHGVYVMDRISISTSRQQVIDGFVEAGMLDDRDQVICIEAANWTLCSHSFRGRPQQPQFPDELDEERPE